MRACVLALLGLAAAPVCVHGGAVYDMSHLSDDMRAFAAAETTHLKAVLELARTDPAALAHQIRASPLAQVAREVTVDAPRAAGNGSLPLVVAHGMGDSCFNPGMKSITKAAGNRLGVYATCIPTGDNFITDTIDGFLKNMDASVDAFAKKVRADPRLKDGFDAFGLSQGNNVIRGYITRYNDPPVRTFMSICGVNAGVGAFPNCAPSTPVLGLICGALTEVLGALAYNSLVQGILFQANYFRDPKRVHDAAYLKHSQLAAWNGESAANADYQANWAKTSKFVWVEGTLDTVVWPREGEQWAAMSEKKGEEFKVVHAMKETRWYEEDLFGLRTADEAGKNFFESFKGEHIQMTVQELYSWLDKHFK